MRTRTDLTSKTFALLMVVRMLPARKMLCRCACGSEVSVHQSNVTSGKTTSCGCAKARLIGDAHRVHGDSESNEFKTWMWMRDRCANPNNPGFHKYGGRGIFVCSRWGNYANFLLDMGRRPSKEHSIDRRDNNGPYSPDNCHWATKKEQSRNTRRSTAVGAFGEVLTIAEWEERTGIRYGTIWSRIKDLGWNAERALTVPGNEYHRGGHRYA